jgi:hypothetical protein
MISLSIVTPDMCVAAFVYLACGILLRMQRSSDNYLLFILLGAVLGFSYLAKAVMFPLAFVFLALGFFSSGNFRKALPRSVIALIIFLVVAGPFIAAISNEKEKFTFGETGKFNYHLVSKFTVGRYWDGTRSDSGTPKHPPRQIFNVPEVYEFGSPINGTYPVWYDPSYWYEGLEIHFNLKDQLRIFEGTLKSYFRIIYPDYSILLFAVLILYLAGGRGWFAVKDLAELWFLLIPAFTALGMYFVVFVDPRYVAPFLTLLWLVVLSGIRLPESGELRRLLKYATILVVLVIMTISTSQALTNRHFYSDDTHVQVAETIRRMGILPGDRVASIGYSHSHFWARLAKVRIVAEIPDEKAKDFWEARSETKLKVIETFGKTGAKAVVTGLMQGHTPSVGWKRIGNSKYYAYKIPPVDTVSPRVSRSVFDEIPPEYFKTDVSRLIEIREPEDIAVFRSRLIEFLWGDKELPGSLPAAVIKGFTDLRYRDITGLERIDRIVVRMDFGLESHIYHFLPKRPNNKLIIFHQGHDGDFYYSKEEIKEFLHNGYSVVAFCMPLRGLNNRPTVYLPRLGFLKLAWNHDFMKFLSPINGHPIRYFIEPVIIALNYLDDNYSYRHISMVGISGGGWTTTMSAAIDTRIKISFPVAGSLPIYLRSNSRNDWGDYENSEPKLYNTVNYPELYILGASGNGRKQLQILNKYDSCCFEGIKWQTYKDVVRSRVFELGPGEYNLFMDDTHRHHQISPVAIKLILNELDEH